jgi:hypothetical protein
VGAWGAALTLTALRGDGARVAGLLYRFEDGGTVATVRVRRDQACERCGPGRTPFTDAFPRPAATRVCGGAAWEIWPRRPGRLDLAAVAARWRDKFGIAREGPTLRVEGEGMTAIFFEDGRALVYGAADEAAARRWYGKCLA